jgi:hypothetical protein
MRFLVVILLLMAAVPAITYVGNYSGRFVLVTGSYVLQLPQNFSDSAIISGRYNVNLAPKIKVNDRTIANVISVVPDSFVNPADKFAFEDTQITDTADVLVRTEIKDKYIATATTVTSKAKMNIKLDLVFEISSSDNFVLFSPALYEKKSETYFAVLNGTSLEGPALGIITSHAIQPTYSNLASMPSYSILLSVGTLKPGESFTMSVTYRPFDLERDVQRPYPSDITAHLQEPLIRMTDGAPLKLNFTNQSTNMNKVEAILTALINTTKAEGEFTALHDVVIGMTPYDSLTTSSYMKQNCRAYNIPCKLVIGQKSGKYYAWIQAWTNRWTDVDPQVGLVRKPDYNAIYTEPTPELHLLDTKSDAAKALYDATLFLKSTGESPYLMYLIIIVAAGVAFFFLLQFKAGLVTKLVIRKKPERTVRLEINGKYAVLKEDIDDAFLKDLLIMVKEKDGVVDARQLAAVLHVSQELVEYQIGYLRDQGYLKRVG